MVALFPWAAVPDSSATLEADPEGDANTTNTGDATSPPRTSLKQQNKNRMRMAKVAELLELQRVGYLRFNTPDPVSHNSPLSQLSQAQDVLGNHAPDTRTIRRF